MWVSLDAFYVHLHGLESSVDSGPGRKPECVKVYQSYGEEKGLRPETVEPVTETRFLGVSRLLCRANRFLGADPVVAVSVAPPMYFGYAG